MADVLSKLGPPAGANKKAKRVGRGPGSGLGKTCGRGQKGQKSRSGGGVHPGFEGGQMPLQRRLPKRGFTNPFRKHWAVVNVGRLDVFDNGAVVDVQALLERGLISKVGDGVKILGKGEIKKKLTVRVHAISAGALAKIEKAGGAFEEMTGLGGDAEQAGSEK
jgi:large subunit ribosomal protein L15